VIFGFEKTEGCMVKYFIESR